MNTPNRFWKKHGLILAACIAGTTCVQAQSLTHRYSFNDTAGNSTFADSVNAATGTLVGAAALDGTQLQLDGAGSYGSLPANMVNTNASVTIEFWATFSPANPVWSRVFAFGDQNGLGQPLTSLDYTHYAGGNYQNLSLSTGGGSAYANNPAGLNGMTNVHVTVIVNPPLMSYLNGTVVMSTLNGTVPPLSGLNDVYGLIGRGLFDIDPTLNGSIDEFRIYSGVVSSAQIALNDAAGPNNIVTNPGSITAIHFSTPTSFLVVNQNSQQALTGDFTGLGGVDLIAYGGATFTSLTPSVVTISTNGLVKAIGSGSGQVVASFGGLSATNSFTVAVLPPSLTHRYSFTSDATDSVGGANGTLVGTAAVSGGQLVLDGNAGTYLDLPAGQINLRTNSAVTFDAWVNFGNRATWAYLFGFGDIVGGGGSGQIACVPCAEGGGLRHWGITENFSGGQTLAWAHGWNNLSAHITCVVDPLSSTISIYRDGVLEVAQYNANGALSNVPTNYAFLGRSFYASDPYLNASIDEFRIYSGALTPAQVALSQQSGAASTNIDPGALNSIVVVPTNYPAFASLVPPVIRANYANLAGFNMLPTVTAGGNGEFNTLVVTSSDTNIISVNSQKMLTTGRPGTVTLTASFKGLTNSAVVRVGNVATLTHRYTFASDASDSIGGANGSLQGAATISSGALQLTGGNADYLQLPAGLLTNYNAVTVDSWVTFGAANNWARLWEFADISDGVQQEFYFGPGWNNPPTANLYSFGAPWGASINTPLTIANQTVHLTCTCGDGWIQIYTNAVLMGSVANVVAPANTAGQDSSTIGHSPFNDPGINGSVDEFRIYRGRLSAEEIKASDILGPTQLLTTTTTLSATASGGNKVLSWPLAAAGFALQSSTNLTSGWTTLTNAPSISGSNWQIVIPGTGGTTFYRLVR